MNLTRRRFLSVTAACAATPAVAEAPVRWQGRAFGADVSLELNGPTDKTLPALEAALADIQRIDSLFSLYQPTSELRRLNAAGRLNTPSPEMLELLKVARQAYELTDERFDPTVQPLWQALSSGGDIRRARRKIGFGGVRIEDGAVILGKGQLMTFNGIAQGYATDKVARTLRHHGLDNVHIDIGENLASGPPRRLGLFDPDHGFVGTVTLKDAAVATSSPGAMMLADGTHIVGPKGEPAVWSTVTVMAQSAALADALSTGLCLAPAPLVTNAARYPGVLQVLTVDAQGNLRSFLG